MLTQERLKELFHYCPETGIFTRIKKVGNCNTGTIAGYKNNQGYFFIRIDYKLYRCHRLVWLYVHGEFPKHEIDHINGIRHDNRLCNLRDVTKSINMLNQKKSRKDSNVGLQGVKKDHNRYQARLTINGICKNLGSFENPEDAHNAYLNAKYLITP